MQISIVNRKESKYSRTLTNIEMHKQKENNNACQNESHATNCLEMFPFEFDKMFVCCQLQKICYFFHIFMSNVSRV